MTKAAVLHACREFRYKELEAPVHAAGRYALVNWLRDALGQLYVKGFDPDWDEVLVEVERVRGDWPASLVGWNPPSEEPMPQTPEQIVTELLKPHMSRGGLRVDEVKRLMLSAIAKMPTCTCTGGKLANPAGRRA